MEVKRIIRKPKHDENPLHACYTIGVTVTRNGFTYGSQDYKCIDLPSEQWWQDTEREMIRSVESLAAPCSS